MAGGGMSLAQLGTGLTRWGWSTTSGECSR